MSGAADWEPVEFFGEAEVSQIQLVGYRTPGWYFKDPSQVHSMSWMTEGHRIEGPYPSKELALREYYSYCEAMTI